MGDQSPGVGAGAIGAGAAPGASSSGRGGSAFEASRSEKRASGW
jgi:hypothetical protein